MVPCLSIEPNSESPYRWLILVFANLRRKKKIAVFPLTLLTLFHTLLCYFLSVKVQNKKVKHRPSTKYLYFYKITGPILFFSGEKQKNKKKFLQPTDQIFYSMLVDCGT